MVEIWNDILGYEGLYEVSNWGRIRRNGKILRPRKSGYYGYLSVALSKNGNERQVLIHRLVASAFLPNPQNFPCINHKDEDKTNNAVDNLEWCDHQYNCNYGTRNERVAEKKSKPVIQYDLLGNFIEEYKSTHEAERKTRIDNNCISRCCNGKYKTAGGFVWRYKN